MNFIPGFAAKRHIRPPHTAEAGSARVCLRLVEKILSNRVVSSRKITSFSTYFDDDVTACQPTMPTRAASCAAFAARRIDGAFAPWRVYAGGAHRGAIVP